MSVTDSTSKRITRKVHDLIDLNQNSLVDRHMIRTIMDGGKEAVAMLLGARVADHQLELPIPNLMLSASNRLAYKIGKVPLLRVDAPMHINSTRAREYGVKRSPIILSIPPKYKKGARISIHPSPRAIYMHRSNNTQ